MDYGKITGKQKDILDYIKNEILNKGYPPSVRDICQAVGLKSTSSVHAHLETLEKNGYIRRDPTKPRTIEIVDDTFNLTRREVSLCWPSRILKATSLFRRRICPAIRFSC